MKPGKILSCACGCGFVFNTSTPPWCYPSYQKLHKYKVGHGPGPSGRKWTLKERQAHSKIMKVAMADPLTRELCAQAKRGTQGWSKGLTKETCPSLMARAQKQVGSHPSEATKIKLSNHTRLAFLNGKSLSVAVHSSNRLAKREIVVTRLGTFRCDSPEEKEFLALTVQDQTVTDIVKDFPVPYLFQEKLHTFFVDFKVDRSSIVELVELRGFSRYGRQERAKYLGAAQYASRNHYDFALCLHVSQ